MASRCRWACGEPVTRVAAIQGDGEASPLAGEGHVIEAVVTAVYPAFDGFYVMETEAHRDNDPATSEGLFVYQPEADVSAGDRVRVSGTVDEYYGLTQISADDRAVCEQGLTVSPVALTLPFDDPADREALEGMLVSVEQPLTVSDNYELARYGSMTLSNGRLFNPTNVAEPGAAARAVKDANERNQVLLDDASNEQNPATVIYPDGGLAADNTLRAGYHTRPFQAVFTYGFNEWRLQPVGEVAFDTAANPALRPRTGPPAAICGWPPSTCSTTSMVTARGRISHRARCPRCRGTGPAAGQAGGRAQGHRRRRGGAHGGGERRLRPGFRPGAAHRRPGPGLALRGPGTGPSGR